MGHKTTHVVTERLKTGTLAGLTQDGRTVLRFCHEAASAVEEQMLAGLSPADCQRLVAALRSCVDALT